MLAALAGAIWSGYWAYTGRTGTRLRDAAWLVTTAIGLEALSGAISGFGGLRPAEPLHFVVGPLTLLALPAAVLLSRGRSERTASYVLFAGWLVTFVLSLRATGSGGLAG